MPSSDFYLFVSHVSEDRAAASEIVAELEKRGVPCWVAPRNVTPGSRYDDQIADAIEGCRAMILVFSDRCNSSEYIHREITVAGESRKVIIPFRIEDARPKRGLSVRLLDLHWIDGFVEREHALDELAAAVTENTDARIAPLPAASPAPADIAPSKPLPQRRKDDVPQRWRDDTKRGPESAIDAPASAAPPRRTMSRNLRFGLVAVVLVIAVAGARVGGVWGPGAALWKTSASPPTPAPFSQDSRNLDYPLDLTGLTTLAGGLQYKDIAPGTGDAIDIGRYVCLRYASWQSDGTPVEPSHFYFGYLGENALAPGIDQALEGMRVGGRRAVILSDPNELFVVEAVGIGCSGTDGTEGGASAAGK